MKKIICILLTILLVTGCSTSQEQATTINNTSSTNNIVTNTSSIDYTIDDEYSNWEDENPQYINLDKIDEINIDGINVSSNTLEITKSGTYVFSGALNKGQIVVNVTIDENVRIVLNGVTIEGIDDAAIKILECKNCILTLAKDSINSISNNVAFNDQTEADASIYSKQDLKINGEGTLNITNTINDGIKSKDDLFILGGVLNIKVLDDGIVGKDSVRIKDGEINITSSGDGIKATNDTDETRGYILINGGTININSQLDGIQSINDLIINGGSISIVTSTGADKTKISTQDNFNRFNQNNTSTSSNDESTKGLKSDNSIYINDGTININSLDDAIHSVKSVEINGSSLTIQTNDDAIHSDNELIINDGMISIDLSYEGLEGSSIVINNGTIKLIALDDGINVNENNSLLTINGGTIEVNADGDGIDSNGNIIITNGYTLVYGPTNSNNGALDFSGTLEITGGTLIALGASGMAQAPSDISSQYSIAKNIDSTSSIIIKDASGNIIENISAPKNFTSVVYSSPDITKDNTYTIEYNSQSISINIDSIVSGDSFTGFGGMGGSGFNKGKPEASNQTNEPPIRNEPGNKPMQ